MKTMMRNSMVLAVFVGVLAVSGYSQEGRLAGGWDTVVKIVNCDTGATIRTFNSFGTFSQGGTFSGITAGTPPTMRSPELGIWRHVRGDVYILRFKAFQYDPATGNPTVYQVVTHEVVLDPDNLSYASAGGVQIFNMAGVQIGTGCSTAVGTRMVL